MSHETSDSQETRPFVEAEKAIKELNWSQNSD